MTDNTRALLEQALDVIIANTTGKDDLEAAIRAELAKPVEPSYTATQLAAMVLSDCGISTNCTMLHERVARRIALHEEQLIDNLKARHEQELAAYKLTVANLRAERDELLRLINRRKIHPHDIPLEIFIADLSTRTANVLRAEFDPFRHKAGTYDIEPPFTVRHLLMFSRQEIKKWPGIGKKGLNEIEENLRARGLQLWHAHDDRSLRLLREHKSYFVDPAKAEGVAA